MYTGQYTLTYGPISCLIVAQFTQRSHRHEPQLYTDAEAAERREAQVCGRAGTVHSTATVRPKQVTTTVR